MAKSGVEWTFSLLDRVTNPARRITKVLNGVGATTQKAQRQGSIFGNAMARSLGLSERHAQRLAMSFRAVGAASQGFQTAQLRAQRLGNTLGRMRGAVFNLPSLLVTGAAGLAGKGFIDAMGFIEQQRIALGTLLNDPIKGKAALDWAIGFADVTPFETPDVLSAMRVALARGYNTRQIEPLLTTLGDTASSLALGPQGLNDLITIFGQIKSAGRLLTDDVNQLTDRGIAAWDIIAKGLGKSTPQVRKMLEQGQIGSDTALTLLFDALTERYGGGMAAQAGSLFGLASTLKSRISTFAAAAEDRGALGPIKRLFGNLVNATDVNSPAGQQLVQRIADATKSLGEGTFGKLADMLEPGKIGQTIERVLGWLERVKLWWDENSPGLIQQARAFGGGVGQGFRDVLDILNFLGDGVRWLGRMFEPLDAAQGKTAGGSSKLFARFATVGVALGALNTLTLGLAGTLTRWAVPALLSLGRAALVAMGPWGWLAAGIIAIGVAIYKNWDKIGPFFEGLWKAISKWAENAWDDAVDAGADALQWFRTLPDRIGSALRNMWDSLTRATGDAWQWIVDQVFIAWDWLRDIPGNLKQWFANLWDGFKSHTQAAWEGVKSAIQGALDTFRDFVRSITNWTPPEWFNRFTPAGIANTGAERVMNQDAAADLAKLGLPEIPSWLEPYRVLPLFKHSESVGKKLVEGILAGSIQSEPELLRGLSRLTDRTTRLVNGQYQIQSPSKVFEKIGRNLTLGLARGVTSTQAVAARAVTGMTAATLATAAVAAPIGSTPGRAASPRPAVQVQITINDARDPDRVLEQLRQRFPVLVAEAFEQLALEEGSSG